MKMSLEKFLEDPNCRIMEEHTTTQLGIISTTYVVVQCSGEEGKALATDVKFCDGLLLKGDKYVKPQGDLKDKLDRLIDDFEIVEYGFHRTRELEKLKSDLDKIGVYQRIIKANQSNLDFNKVREYGTDAHIELSIRYKDFDAPYGDWKIYEIEITNAFASPGVTHVIIKVEYKPTGYKTLVHKNLYTDNSKEDV